VLPIGKIPLLSLLVLLLATLSGPSALRGAETVDSLRAIVDSLARRADSLAVLADSFAAARTQKAQAPAPAGPAEVKGPWQGGLGLGLSLNYGNSRQSALISDLDAKRQGRKTRFISHASMTNAGTGERNRTSKGNLRSKFELNQNSRLFYFSSLDLDYNRQAGLNLRVSPGFGAGLGLISGKRARVNLNIGVNLVSEYLRDKPGSTSGHYLVSQDAQIRFNGNIRLEQNISFSPRFEQPNNYLVNLSASLIDQVTRNFSLNVNLEGHFNSRPPFRIPPYKRQDWTFYTSLNYSFW
jgi:putative salt-induced outer membrane protein YdiY